MAGGFPRVLFPPLWCFPPTVSGWGSVWVGLTPRDDLASTGFHDCLQRTVRQPRPTRPRLATGARPSVPHHHPIRPRRARPTSRPTSEPMFCRGQKATMPVVLQARIGRVVYQVKYGTCSLQNIDPLRGRLAFTRYPFTSGLLCANQLSFYPPRPPAWPTLVQYYCTIITQYKIPFPTSRLYAIRHTILVITISCKGQETGHCY